MFFDLVLVRMRMFPVPCLVGKMKYRIDFPRLRFRSEIRTGRRRRRGHGRRPRMPPRGPGCRRPFQRGIRPRGPVLCPEDQGFREPRSGKSGLISAGSLEVLPFTGRCGGYGPITGVRRCGWSGVNRRRKSARRRPGRGRRKGGGRAGPGDPPEFPSGIGGGSSRLPFFMYGTAFVTDGGEAMTGRPPQPTAPRRVLPLKTRASPEVAHFPLNPVIAADPGRSDRVRAKGHVPDGVPDPRRTGRRPRARA